MSTPCYYCEENRKVACRACIHDYNGPRPEEVIAWKRDAARYRWLRDHRGGGHAVVNGDLLEGSELDENIDAALRAAAEARKA